MDDPGPCPPKLVFLDHFFGENVLFHQFDPTNTPKCYTWLESYGSPLRDGKNGKIFFWTCEASDFRGRSQTDFLHDLEARPTQIIERYGYDIWMPVIHLPNEVDHFKNVISTQRDCCFQRFYPRPQNLL